MASGHVNRANRPNTWLHRPACDVKKVLANSEPSTHGHFSDVRSGGDHVRSRGAERTSRLRRPTSENDPISDIYSSRHLLPSARPRPPTEWDFRLADTANHEVLSRLAPAW